MRWRWLGLLLAVVATTPSCTFRRSARPPRPAPAGGVVVAVDRREELFSVLFRLADAGEVRRAPSTRYVRDVDAHFAAFAGHPAVAATRALRATSHLGRAEVERLVVCLDPDLRLACANPPAGDPRWAGLDVEGYLAQVRAFEAASGAAAFFLAREPYFRAVEERFRRLLASAGVVAWLDAQLGVSEGAMYTVFPGLLTGAESFGASAAFDDGVVEQVLVLSLEGLDAEELPRPGDATLEALVGGLARARVTPALAGHRAALEPSLAALLKRVGEPLREQAVATPLGLGDESLVRALTALFLQDTRGPRRAEAFAVDEARRSFFWVGELAAQLVAWRGERGAAKGLESFVPRLATFFDGLEQRYARAGLPTVPFHGPISAVAGGAGVLVSPKRGTLTRGLLQDLNAVRKELLPTALVVEDTIPWADLAGRDVVLYGSPWSNQLLDDLLRRAGWQVTPEGVLLGGRRFDGPDLALIAARANPADPSHGALVYTAAKDETLVGVHGVAHGATDWVVARRRPDGTFETVAEGSFGGRQ